MLSIWTRVPEFVGAVGFTAVILVTSGIAEEGSVMEVAVWGVVICLLAYFFLSFINLAAEKLRARIAKRKGPES
ncbi:hypothetical protein ACT3SZ_10315 [Corynebacterium sp. AOP40-9SA-29]|uniref:hypothetical protein n=1 Tax=Corynebacterium sp. AOP40-9SA-29 TaxID=3457677 RepID=UPI0040349F21